MSVTKKIYGDYTVSTASDPSANILLSTHTVYIEGNLVVGGNATAVTKTDVDITDNTITLNKGETGAGVTAIYAGINIDRGSLIDVGLRWNENFQRWELSNNGVTYGNISTSSGSGSIAVIDDPAPTLGGNLNLYGRSIYSNVAPFSANIDANIALKITSVSPGSIPGYTVIYSLTPGSGGTGLYVTNNTVGTVELTTVKKSIVYSLVL